MKPEADLEEGDFRLLEVDNPVVLPLNTHVRVIVTSTDVLHDFALPSAGVKIDAAPGRLNQCSLFGGTRSCLKQNEHFAHSPRIRDSKTC